jgi:hypothetical protein
MRTMGFGDSFTMCIKFAEVHGFDSLMRFSQAIETYDD